MIGPDDIEAFAPDLSAADLDAVQTLYRAVTRMQSGVPEFMEFPARDMEKVMRGALIGWELWARVVEEQHRQATSAMGVFDRQGHATS